MKAEHLYELIFTENEVDLYSVDKFLYDFEMLCKKYHVTINHVYCHLFDYTKVEGKII